MTRLYAAVLLGISFAVLVFASHYGWWVWLGALIAGVLVSVRDSVLGQ